MLPFARGGFNALNQLLEDGWPVIITFAVIIVVILSIHYWPRIAVWIEQRWFSR